MLAAKYYSYRLAKKHHVHTFAIRRVYLKYFPITGRLRNGRSWYMICPINAITSTVLIAMRRMGDQLSGSACMIEKNSRVMPT